MLAGVQGRRLKRIAFAIVGLYTLFAVAMLYGDGVVVVRLASTSLLLPAASSIGAREASGRALISPSGSSHGPVGLRQSRCPVSACSRMSRRRACGTLGRASSTEPKPRRLRTDAPPFEKPLTKGMFLMTEPRSDYTRRQVLEKAAVGAVAIGALGSLPASAWAKRVAKAKTVTLTWAAYQEPSRAPIYAAILKDFAQKHPNIKLNFQTADFTTYYTKLTTNIAAGTTPDVFLMSGAYFYQAVYRKALQQLDPFMKASNVKLSDYFSEQADTVYQGKTYAIPAEFDITALAYNKDLFDAAGVKYPTNNWTWTDMLDAALKVTNPKKKTYGIYSWNSSQEMWGALVDENGGSFLNHEMTKGALDQPEAIQAIQFAVDMIRKYKVSPPPEGVSSLPGYIQSGGSPFLTGLIGMKFQGNYEMGVLSKIHNINWDIVLMPRKKKQGGIGWLQSWVMGSKTKHPEEAWTLLNYLVTDGQKIMANDPGRGLTPSLKSVAYSPAYVRKAPPHVKSWLDGWGIHFEFDFHPGWFEYQNAYGKALDAVFAGSQTVQAAMTSATKDVNDILARYPWYSRSTR